MCTEVYCLAVWFSAQSSLMPTHSLSAHSCTLPGNAVINMCGTRRPAARSPVTQLILTTISHLPGRTPDFLLNSHNRT
eukprot:scaffold645_cov31-Tisochrysis_lutea.AAC.2